MAKKEDAGVSGEPVVRFTGKHKRRVVIAVPCQNKGAFYLRKKRGFQPVSDLAEKLGFQTSTEFLEGMEVFGMKKAEIARVRADAQLCEYLTYLVDECGLYVRSETKGLAFGGRTLSYKKQNQEEVLHAIREVARILDAMERLSSINVRSYQSTAKWILTPAYLALFVAIIYLELATSALTLSHLVLPGLMLSVVSGLLLGFMPAFLMRRGPFAAVILRSFGWMMLAMSLSTGFSLAHALNSAGSQQEQTIRYAGNLAVTHGRHAHHYLRADDGVSALAFNDDVSDVSIDYYQYSALLGPNKETAGTFEVTVEKGLLGAPYITHIKRVSTAN
jgi:hypothetical protein